MMKNSIFFRKRNENGDIIASILVIAGFAVVAILGINYLSGSITGRAKEMSALISEDTNTETTLPKNKKEIVSKAYWKTSTALSEKDSELGKEIEEFRIKNIGQTGAILVIPNFEISTATTRASNSYETYVEVFDQAGTLDVGIRLVHTNSEPVPQNSSYLSFNPNETGL